MKFGTTPYNPSSSSEIPKVSSRQRWNPSPEQLQILEGAFNQGNGTPCKQQIAEITSELAKHGHVSDIKVYNWFQNKRARFKRRQADNLKTNTENFGSSGKKKTKLDEVLGKEDLIQPEPNRKVGKRDSDDCVRSLCGMEPTMPLYNNVACCQSVWPLSFPRL